MNKKRIIEGIFSESAAIQGYEYVTEKGMYCFNKKVDCIKRVFMIQDIYYSCIRLNFLTNICGPVDATVWVDKSICNINDMKVCEYNNEEEFRTIILEAKRIFEQYSEETFQKLSIPPKDVSTPEMEKDLYDNRAHLINEGIKFLNIEGMIGLKRIRMIVEKIRELEGKPFQSVISELIMLSAVYGNIYCEMSHGEWKFDGKVVSIVNDEIHVKTRPLKRIIHAWKHNEDELLTSDCLYAEQKYNRCWT